MDRKFREKIKESINKTEDILNKAETSMDIQMDSPDKREFEENIKQSAEKLIALLPNSINRAKLVAQVYSGKAFDVLISLMEDEMIHPEIRRKCANDLLNRGWGLPEQQIRSVSVNAAIEIPPETFVNTDISLQANAFVESGVPSDQWPDEVKHYFGLSEGD